MKKIFLILFCFLNFSYASVYFLSISDLIAYEETANWGQYYIYNGVSTGSGVSSYTVPTVNGSCNSEMFSVSSPTDDSVRKFYNYTGSNGTSCYFDNLQTFGTDFIDCQDPNTMINGVCVSTPTCNSNEVLVDNVCQVVGQQGPCSAGNVVLSDEGSTTTGSCTNCSNGYAYNFSQETCTRDCSLTVPTVDTREGWQTFINVYNSDTECYNFSSQYGHIYSFGSLTNDGCTYHACSVFVYNNDDPCNSLDPLVYPSPDWVYKGIVTSDSECQAYVLKSHDYLNASTQKASSKCKDNIYYYCYVLPTLDNPDTGITPPDFNNSNPDGTIPLPNNLPNADINTSAPSLSSDSVDKSNALIGQLTGDFKDYFKWQKIKNGTYSKALTDFGRNFLKGQYNQKMSNDNSNTNKIVDAVNNSKTDTSGIESKLDTLIGSDTSDSSAETLSSISSITSSLTDFNGSNSLDSNFTKNFSDDELNSFVTTAYDGFGDRVTTALTTVFNSIDYGIVDLFTVPSYSFQDVVLPDFDLPMGVSITNQKVMSADFLNSLDFTMGRLALLLVTLLGCVYYVINRLFP